MTPVALSGEQYADPIAKRQKLADKARLLQVSLVSSEQQWLPGT